MSFRSALNNPTPSSGNVGLVITAGNTNYDEALTNNVPKTFATITLGAGTWSIQMTETVEYNTTNVTAVVIFLERETDNAKYFSRNLIVPNTSLQTTGIENDMVNVTITEATTLKLVAVATFSSGIIRISYPEIDSAKFLTATKLA